MEQHDKGLSAALTRETLNQLPLLTLMENAPLPWALKSHDSRYVYINQAAQDFANIPVGFDFEGRLDGEFPTPWAEFAADYQAHDRKAQASPEGAEIITTSYFTRNAVLEPWYCAKFPLYDGQGEVLGTFCYAKRFTFLSLWDFCEQLKPSVISLTPPDDTFNEKELNIIFFAIQKFSAKEIAAALGLSHRTVENRLCTIYSKVGINSLSALIDYCQATGLNHYIPRKRLREGVNFFW